MKEATPPATYGGRGRPWHDNFIKYMEAIVSHPTYRGMPDAYYEPGRIQWEAPSNRASGQFRETHQRRRAWWEAKAAELGIDTTKPKWISRVAKTIHPTKRKPCKICGRELELRYVYPQDRFLTRLRRVLQLPTDYPLDRLESLSSLLQRLYGEFGNEIIRRFPGLFPGVSVPLPSNVDHASITDWVTWVETVLVPTEPRFLSPGAMSNAPDRFDGFHCDNLCCRSEHDKGRHKANLSTYVTDRRVFEYWNSGNWVAADRLMGQIRSRLKSEKCALCDRINCDADHIGPLSLGFNHRPKFQLLCSAHNSAKNNRMFLSDVECLKADELAGESVISWHSKPLWDLLKGRVTTDEHARRISKILRDVRHNLMFLLQHVYESGHFTFLAGYLELGHADFDYSFPELAVVNGITRYSTMEQTPRETKYAVEQKARRCRIAFAELATYFTKENRNAFLIESQTLNELLRRIAGLLDANRHQTRPLDEQLKKLVDQGDQADALWRAAVPQIQCAAFAHFTEVRHLMVEYMEAIANQLSTMWNAPRYVREV